MASYISQVVSKIRTYMDKVQIKTVSATSYTALASDSGKVLKFTASTDVTFTIPTGLGASWDVGIDQDGSGQVIPTASGTTIKNRQGHTRTAGQDAVARIYAKAADVFNFSGDTAT